MNLWDVVAGAALSALGVWLVLVAVLFVARPRRELAVEALRLIPDLVRLIGRLCKDTRLPRSSRVWLMILAIYLASPIDIVPDFLPFVGYADDVIAIVLVLRSVIRSSGIELVTEHWPGSEEGLSIVLEACGARPQEF